MSTRKVARNAIDGRFVSRRAAHRWPQNTVVETIEYPSSRRLRRRRAVSHVTEENQNRHGFKAGKDAPRKGRTPAATSKPAVISDASRS